METRMVIEVFYKVYRNPEGLWVFSIANLFNGEFNEYPFFAADNMQDAHDAAKFYLHMLESNIKDDLKRWTDQFQKKELSSIKKEYEFVPEQFPELSEMEWQQLYLGQFFPPEFSERYYKRKWETSRKRRDFNRDRLPGEDEK